MTAQPNIPPIEAAMTFREITFDAGITAPGVENLQAARPELSNYQTKPRKINRTLSSDVLRGIASFFAVPGHEAGEFSWFREKLMDDGSKISAHVRIEVANIGNPDEIIEMIATECKTVLDAAVDELTVDPVGIWRKQYVDAILQFRTTHQRLDRNQTFILWRDLCGRPYAEIVDMYNRLPEELRRNRLLVCTD